MADGLWLMVRKKKEWKMAFRFEGLEIFHAAIDFSATVHETVKTFPSEERFDLTSQARRAANSIVLNIAEGSGRGTKKDFSHFLDMALGSIFENCRMLLCCPEAILCFRARLKRNGKKW
jgi:four helix bundle protein